MEPKAPKFEVETLAPRTKEQSVSSWVSEQLRGFIASGEYGPGDRIPGERQLSEQLNVSRVSVRAALQNLKAQGLLSSVQGGGTRVIAQAPELDSPLAELAMASVENFQDLLDLRDRMTVWAAGKAAVMREGRDIEALEAIDRQLADAQSPSERHLLDLKFHAHVMKASGSSVFLHLGSVMEEVVASAVLESTGTRSLTQEESLELAAIDHGILSALRSQNQAEVQRLMERRLGLRRQTITGGTASTADLVGQVA